MVNDISKLQANDQVKQEIDIRVAEKKQYDIKNVNPEKQDAAPKIDNESKEQEEVKSSVYGDVIGASKDGDTVSAKKQAMEALNTGMVFKKTVEEDPVKKAQKVEEKKEKKETSELEIATDDQLDAMFEQGKISKIKYDEENKRREILRGEEDKKDKKDFLIEENEEEQKREKTADIKSENKVENKEIAESKVQNAKVSENKFENKAIIKDETDKLEDEKEASKVKDSKVEENRKEAAANQPKRTFDIEEEVKDDKAFAEQMGRMVAKENDEKIRSDAMEEAVKNGRDELMTQIFATGLE